MKPVFADTFYYLALTNPKDRHHAEAVSLSKQQSRRILTSAWVLMELGDALSNRASRKLFHHTLRFIEADPFTKIIPPRRKDLREAIELHSRRIDKDWSLTDCTSFIIMSSSKIEEALTGDVHFEQAGFRAIFR